MRVSLDSGTMTGRNESQASVSVDRSYGVTTPQRAVTPYGLVERGLAGLPTGIRIRTRRSSLGPQRLDALSTPPQSGPTSDPDLVNAGRSIPLLLGGSLRLQVGQFRLAHSTLSAANCAVACQHVSTAMRRQMGIPSECYGTVTITLPRLCPLSTYLCASTMSSSA